MSTALATPAAKSIYEDWCSVNTTVVSTGRNLHLLSEKSGGRGIVGTAIVETVHSHYEDPTRLADRINRLGYPKAFRALKALLPKSKKARSGHIGEILAAEVVPSILPNFTVPLKRLRWLDGRENALRGEDIIGIDRTAKRVRFLKGESKSRVNLTPSVVGEARTALVANKGRPSEHAMAFVKNRLFELGDDALALIFEEYLLEKSIPINAIVHLLFTLSGNDASAALRSDLTTFTGHIEQHAVNLRITDHQDFIGSLYKA
jgi:hypothetical protein